MFPQWSRALATEFHSEVLYGNTLVVVGRRGHPMASATSLAELLACQWVQHGPANGPGALLEPAFRAHQLPPPVPRVGLVNLTPYWRSESW